MLTALILLPLVGALLLLRRDESEGDAIRLEATIVTGLVALVSALVYLGLGAMGDQPAFEFETDVNIFPAYGIHYHLGVDGVSGLLVMLTSVLGVVAVVSSWAAITRWVRRYYICLLLLESAMIGVFCALDLFVFYVFWEMMLLPMVFLIGIWGGERRIYASIKFVLYTLVGSLLMLVAIIWVAGSGGPWTFDLVELYQRPVTATAQLWAFAAFGLAFAIKVPLFPLHTWLPDAHTEAPTAGSILLAGVLLKMGTYGFIRIALPLFPHAAVLLGPFVVALAVIGIIYGALVAMVQPDVKRLVAYSSVAHLGFVMLGLFTFSLAGMQGGMLQQISHGVSTGALFLLVGMIYERRHSRRIADFGGLWEQMPVYSRLFLITLLASVGLPGLCGFVGEFLVLFGTASDLSYGLALVAGSGVILAACYLLWMFQRVFYGPVEHREVEQMRDLDQRELWCIIPLVVWMFWIGLCPNRFLKPAEPAMAWVQSRVQAALDEQTALDEGALAPEQVEPPSEPAADEPRRDAE